MINKIVVYNIECHGRSVIDFKDGVNAIIGSSESGKSTITRLVNSFVYFKPMNLRYDEAWGGAEYHTDKGILTRYREDTIKQKCMACGKITSKNGMCSCGADKFVIHRVKKYDIYSIFGNTVDELRDIINTPDIDIATDPRTKNTCFEKMSKGFKNLSGEIVDALPFPLLEICDGNPWAVGIKQQFDKFIWNELKPSEFSRLFSYLEGNDYVHDMLAYIKKDIKKDENLLNVIEPEILEIEDKIKTGGEVVDAQKKILDDATENKDHFSDLYMSWLELVNMTEKIDKVIFEGKETREKVRLVAHKAYAEVEAALVLFSQYMSTIASYQATTEDMEAIIFQISKFSQISTDVLEKELADYKTLKNLLITCQLVKLDHDTVVSELKSVTDNYESGLEEFNEIILSKNICPYSGFPLMQSCKDLIKEKLEC